jgi:Flp pilus assembly pilin Flp
MKQFITRGIESMRKAGRRMQERAESGQCLIEYSLLAGLVAVIGAVTLMQNPAISNSMQKVVNKVIKVLAAAAAASQTVSC